MKKMTRYFNYLQNLGNVRSVESTAFDTTEHSASGEETADRNRRRFMKINLYGLALAPAASLLFSESAKAVKKEDGVPALLDASDPQAQALDYTAQGPKGQQSCSNCQLYTGVDGKKFGPCSLFSYRRDTRSGKPLMVNSSAWCRAWAPRQL